METKIDKELYSRQIFTIGQNAMEKMSNSIILISGMSGLGIEAAKCVILSGAKKVMLHDKDDIGRWEDLCSNYFINEGDIGKKIVKKLSLKLGELNENVKVIELKTIEKGFDQCDVIVLCNMNIYDSFYWNHKCRENGKKFICLKSYGLMGNIFCDFGEHFVMDIDGEQIREGFIKKFENGIVTTYDPHRMNSGDLVELFPGNNKSRIKSLSIDSFKFIDFNGEKNNINPNKYRQIKETTNIHFESLTSTFTKPKFTVFNQFDEDREKILHVFMIARDMWDIEISIKYGKNGYMPNNIIGKSFENYFMTLFQFFEQFMRIMYPRIKITKELMNQVKKMFWISRSKLCPIDSVIGALGAQEVMKACTQKYLPINQYLHFDALEILPENYDGISNPDYFMKNNRYDSQIALFGQRFQKELEAMRIFVVGSGAIGCEHLKNMSMMGIGKIIITDMDIIEKSNLSRQFLFRRNDIGDYKSEVAARKTMEMNKNINIIPMTNKISDSTFDIYNNDFFSQIDCIATALDNVETRMLVDSLCVQYMIPLLDSGTQGTKGSILTIIPGVTETYGIVKDDKENIPICTIKMFPSKYEHLVHYSREKFEEYFTKKPKNYMKIYESCKILSELSPDELKEIFDDVIDITENRKNFEQCVIFACLQWEKIFRNQIITLNKKYKGNDKNENGDKLWINDKSPIPLEFDYQNVDYLNMIKYFSILWAKMVGVDHNVEHNEINKIKKIIKKNILCETSEKVRYSVEYDDDYKLMRNIIVNMIKMNGKPVEIINFEKDDPTNHHIDLIHVMSVLRGKNYWIECGDWMKTLEIAGKIIPAISTTTSLVSGFVGLELYKIINRRLNAVSIKSDDISKYRSGSFNIAACVFGFAMPMPPKIVKIDDIERNIWTIDEIDVQCISDIIEKYEGSIIETTINGIDIKLRVAVGMIYEGNNIIYSNNDSPDSYDMWNKRWDGLCNETLYVHLEPEDPGEFINVTLSDEFAVDSIIKCKVKNGKKKSINRKNYQ
jgi:ubiquitin-activating enzyme E1